MAGLIVKFCAIKIIALRCHLNVRRFNIDWKTIAENVHVEMLKYERHGGSSILSKADISVLKTIPAIVIDLMDVFLKKLKIINMKHQYQYYE